MQSVPSGGVGSHSAVRARTCWTGSRSPYVLPCLPSSRLPAWPPGSCLSTVILGKEHRHQAVSAPLTPGTASRKSRDQSWPQDRPESPWAFAHLSIRDWVRTTQGSQYHGKDQKGQWGGLLLAGSTIEHRRYKERPQLRSQLRS